MTKTVLTFTPRLACFVDNEDIAGCDSALISGTTAVPSQRSYGRFKIKVEKKQKHKKLRSTFVSVPFRRKVHSTNIGALVTVRFNVASFDANLGDWAWILGGVDPSLDVSEANALLSSEIYSRFSEGCWFYFGRAVTLGHPFLCSRDPNSELASLQSSTSDRVYQYGWFDLYSSASGNVSLWYAIDEDYDFALVHNYYTCGLEIVAPASLVVSGGGFWLAQTPHRHQDLE